MKRYLYLLVLLFIAAEVSAVKPKWLRTKPQAINATYVFVPITVSASNYEDGRNEALRALAVDRGLLNSVRVSSCTETTSDEFQESSNGKLTEHIDIHTIETITFDGKPIKLQAHIVDEYLDVSGGTFSSLYQVAIVDNPIFNNVEVTDRYGAMPMLLSVIPGMGQMYKGSTVKGIALFAVEAAAIGGLIYTENVRASYMSKMYSHPYQAHQYKALADNFTMARNCCVGAAAAVYIYNLIDALVAPGARRIVVKPHNLGIAPMLSQDGGGLSLSYSF